MEVSIIVPIYNHERYLEYAINSILEQKVNFEYEVLIGEDCSTDNSREVLRKLEPSLPTSFKIFYREKNLGARLNFRDLYSRAQGKYLCALEADDFWCNPNKLQLQYDFLENHSDYIAVAHNANVIGDNNQPIKYKYPECKKNEYTYKEFEKGLLPGQTATIMYRNIYKMEDVDTKVYVGEYKAGDRVKAFLFLSYGRVHCIQERMSNYRLVLTHGSSFSANYKPTLYGELPYYKGIYEYSTTHNINKKVKKVTAKMYAWYLLKFYVRKRDKKIKDDLRNIIKENSNKIGFYLYFTKKIILLPFHKIKQYSDKKQYSVIRKIEKEHSEKIN
jgi:glycosyltransferase involved in cell wall biosynthesis